MAVLSANRRVVCPICTVDPDQPVLVDGVKWEMHQRSRGHRLMSGADKRLRRSTSAHTATEPAPRTEDSRDT